MDDEPKAPPPVSEVVAKLRETFAPLTRQLHPDTEPADVYSPAPTKP
jgi:hypothetical protein